MADIFLNRTNAILAKVLDGAAARQKALADNIANAETPGYTRKDVSFEGALVNILERDGVHPQAEVAAIRAVVTEIREDVASPRRADGNNVNLEHEMVTLAKNTLQYEATAQFLSKRIQGLRNAIKEGRG
ncbi:MAG: flagellar basal body rod protein FlgB [Armatimonadota bacterium]